MIQQVTCTSVLHAKHNCHINSILLLTDRLHLFYFFSNSVRKFTHKMWHTENNKRILNVMLLFVNGVWFSNINVTRVFFVSIWINKIRTVFKFFKFEKFTWFSKNQEIKLLNIEKLWKCLNGKTLVHFLSHGVECRMKMAHFSFLRPFFGHFRNFNALDDSI